MDLSPIQSLKMKSRSRDGNSILRHAPVLCASPTPSIRTEKDGNITRSYLQRPPRVTQSINIQSLATLEPGLAKRALTPKDLQHLLRNSGPLRSEIRLKKRLKPADSRTPPVCPSPHDASKLYQESVSNTNYMKRMRRIKSQMREMADLGLISSRGNEPLINDFGSTNSPPAHSRTNTAEFWGYKSRMDLIQKLGFTEAYREFEAMKSVRKSMALSHAHVETAEALRRSCPVSPVPGFTPSLKSSARSTAATSPEGQALNPGVQKINKIMQNCDFFFIEKTGKNGDFLGMKMKNWERRNSDRKSGQGNIEIYT